MSGLEIIALVLNASDISCKVIAAAVDYGQKVRVASKQTEEIKNETQNISKLLDDLHARAEKAKESGSPLHQWPSLKNINSKGSPLIQMKLELEIVLDLLSSKRASKIEHLLWPRKAKKVEKSMQLITKQREALVQSMMIDTGFQTIENDKKLSSIAKENKNSALQYDIDWISDDNHTIYHREASNERMETTGEWIFESDDFIRWKNEKSGILWINGSAGSGKTILCSTIINNLFIECERHGERDVAYFYFKDSQRQEFHDMLQSLIKQLCMKISNLSPTAISTIRKYRTTGEKPNDSQLVGLLQSVVGGAGTDATYIVVDALDECSRRPQLMKSLVSISELRLQNLYILLTSRDLVDIRRVLEPVVDYEIPIGSSEDDLQLSFDLSKHRKAGIKNDIVIYIEQNMAQQHYLNIRSDELKRTIRDKLEDKANGMFRWVACQIDQLSEPLSDEDLLQALNSLPKDLDETYERMLQKILTKKKNQVQAEMVRNLLQWIIAPTKPLLPSIAAQAVLQTSSSCSLHKRLPDLDAVVDICAGLIKKIKDGSEPRLDFVHFSVKEYLVSERILESSVSYFALRTETSHREITKICLNYILLFDQSDFKISEVKKSQPLLLYACKAWKKHVEYGNGHTDMEIINLADRLFDLSRQRFFIISKFLNNRFFKRKRPYLYSSQLYDAVKYGLEENVRRLLQSGADPNCGMGHHGYPLQVAALKKNEELVKLLLSYKADANLAKEDSTSALGHACSAGNRKLVKLLLDNGADPNLGSPCEKSPISKACNHPEILQLLLARGVHQEHSEAALIVAARGGSEIALDMILDSNNDQELINAEDRHEALLVACAEGNEHICQRLLKEDVDLSYKGCCGCPLGNAVEGGNENIVNLLLQNGADVNFKSRYEDRPLQNAVQFNKANIARSLLEWGAEPNCFSNYRKAPLGLAVVNNQPSMVELLLEFGADMHATKYENEYSAFCYAVSQGYMDCVKLFLAHGVDYSREGGRFGGFLLEAMHNKKTKMVDFLLDGESRTKPLIHTFKHALHGAIAVGDEELVKSCLDNGDDVNLIVESRSPLQVAGKFNRKAIAKLLLDKGADINYTSDSEDNVLYNVATLRSSDLIGDYEEMCTLLINYGAPVNRVQGKYGTPLKAAIIWGQQRIVEILLERGADVNLSEGMYGSPLLAAITENKTIHVSVRMLLEYGADPNYHGGEYGSVLQAACYKNDSDEPVRIRRLLDAGADINYAGAGRPSPIEIAHEKKDVPALKVLLLRGAHVPPSLAESDLLEEVRKSLRSELESQFYPD